MQFQPQQQQFQPQQQQQFQPQQQQQFQPQQQQRPPGGGLVNPYAALYGQRR
jgi:hypothetical protein